MKRQHWVAIALAFCIAVVVGAVWYIGHLFPGTKIDTMLFYIANGANSAGEQTIGLALQKAGPVVGVIFALLVLLVYRPAKKPLFTLLPLERVGKLSITKAYALLLAIIVIFALWFFGAFHYVATRFFLTSDLYETHYVHPNDVDLAFPEEPRNLVMIFMESVETSVLSQAAGGGWDYSLMPELEQLAEDNVNFSTTGSIGGTPLTKNAENTTTGIVAQTSGTPLVAGNDINANNAFIDYQEYLAGVTTMADILQDEGYNQSFVLGSDANFGNRKTYFEQHGDVDIFDYEAAKRDGLIDDDYRVWWGYEDKKMFSYAQDKTEELAAKDEPFALTMLTVDTHFVDGYLDSSCALPFDTQYENVHACSSAMTAGYIEWLKQQPYYDNTTVVLVGDHLGMQTNFYTDTIPENYTRTVFNTFINTVKEPHNAKRRTFTAFDMFPTTLSSLGVTIPGDRLGLGTDLFSEQQTLAEEIGLEKFNTEVQYRNEYYNDCLVNGECEAAN